MIVPPGAAPLSVRVVLLGLERVVLKGLTRDRDPLATAAVFFGLGSLTLIPFAWGHPWPTQLMTWAWPAAAILVYTVAFGLYVAALRVGDASIVAPFYHSNALVLVVLAWLFLGESFTAAKALGVLLVVVGAGILETKDGLPSPRTVLARPDARMMLVSAFLIAIGRIIDGAALKRFDTEVYAVINNAGISLLLLAALAARGRLATVPALIRERPVLSVTAGAINGVSYLALLLAFPHLGVGVAEPVSALSLLVTAVVAHAVWKEPLGSRLLGGVVLVAGTWFLFQG